MNNDIQFEDKFTGLKIYTREATYSDNKHFGSFIFWELVDFASNSIVILFLLYVWEILGLRNLFL